MNIERNKQSAIRTLEKGLADGCADDITEVLVNLVDGTCDYVELIPVLQRVASKRSFYYFDDNGAGGFPRADLRRETNFETEALAAIENIKENAGFEADGEIAGALKSNDTDLIKKTLEKLKTEGVCTDKLLIPILEKIVRKDVYQSYSYYSGFKDECRLGELAQSVIEMILQNSTSVSEKDPSSSDLPKQTSLDEKARPAFEKMETFEKCAFCDSLPDDITVNTGREEYFPGAFRQLIGMDSEYRAEYRRCPGCRTYFNWIDMPQMYGSGNCDEERLVRLSTRQSRLLDKLFSTNPKDHPVWQDVEQYFETLPLHLLLPALRSRLYRAPEIVALFVPNLVRLLGKNNDTSIWEMLRSYVSDKPERAEEILEAFRSWDEWGPIRLTQILHQCLNVAAKKK